MPPRCACQILEICLFLLDTSYAARFYDTVFFQFEESLPKEQEHFLRQMGHASENPVCHMITNIANLTNQNLYRLPVRWVKRIMRQGNICSLGVGMASGPAEWRTATMLALERLSSQGASIKDASGVLSCIHGSSLVTPDDICYAEREILDLIPAGISSISAIIIDENLRYNTVVTIMSLHHY